MEKMIWQKFILGCENLEEPLKKGLGGVIFFTKDIKDELGFINLIKEIKKNSLIPPFLSIDQEGGRVERTENIRPRRISPQYAYRRGEDFLKAQSDEILSELYKWGINLNFAPCVDVDTNPNNPIIGERAFAKNPDDVVRAANIFINSSKKKNVIHCIKHYPGHGDADKDSHLSLPQIKLTLKEMEEFHIKPFKELIISGVDMVMVAHLHCTCFDEAVIPTSLSKNALQYLRKDLGFNGVVISDDMVMKGVELFGALEALVMGVKAGVDMFIYRNSDEKTFNLIEEFVQVVKKDKELSKKIIESNDRILDLKRRYGIL